MFVPKLVRYYSGCFFEDTKDMFVTAAMDGVKRTSSLMWVVSASPVTSLDSTKELAFSNYEGAYAACLSRSQYNSFLPSCHLQTPVVQCLLFDFCRS